MPEAFTQESISLGRLTGKSTLLQVERMDWLTGSLFCLRVENWREIEHCLAANSQFSISRKLDLSLCLCLLLEQKNILVYWKFDELLLMTEKTSPPIDRGGMNGNDERLSATLLNRRWWFRIFADCCCDLKQPQWVTRWDLGKDINIWELFSVCFVREGSEVIGGDQP